MHQDLVYVDSESSIPLYGIDFLGIIDRGTNIIEIKPLTICNLKCRYCFVSAGDYSTNFIVNSNYIVENAAEHNAVKELFIVDSLIRGASKEHKLRIEDIISKVEKSQGKINILSSEHPTGKQIDDLGALVAILHYKL